MTKAKLYSSSGDLVSEKALPESFFNSKVSEGCLFLTINAYLANQRQGTHASKTKSEVSGTTKKPWKQKGSGRARSGDNKSPIWVRGSKAHGPQPHDYDKKVNKKVKRRALLSALTIKAQSNSVFVFEGLNFEKPRTSDFIKVMDKAGLAGNKNLYLVSNQDTNTYLSARNITWATVMRVEDVNAYQLMNAKNVVFSNASLEQLTAGAK